jgi:hypothetical protein
VILWHNAIGDGTALQDAIGETDRPLVPVPGGCTVGLRAFWLARGSGFTKLHVYGMDGSYSGGEHHAYPQALNDQDTTIDVVLNGKHYTCAKWMARQANDFQRMWPEITRERQVGGDTIKGMSIWIHGTGLIPDMAALLKASCSRSYYVPQHELSSQREVLRLGRLDECSILDVSAVCSGRT